MISPPVASYAPYVRPAGRMDGSAVPCHSQKGFYCYDIIDIVLASNGMGWDGNGGETTAVYVGGIERTEYVTRK